MRNREERIRAIQDPEDLLEMASKSYFQGLENDLVLQKIREFEGQLTRDDWPEIVGAAEEGSELKRVALAHLGETIPRSAKSLD